MKIFLGFLTVFILWYYYLEDVSIFADKFLHFKTIVPVLFAANNAIFHWKWILKRQKVSRKLAKIDKSLKRFRINFSINIFKNCFEWEQTVADAFIFVSSKIHFCFEQEQIVLDALLFEYTYYVSVILSRSKLWLTRFFSKFESTLQLFWAGGKSSWRAYIGTFGLHSSCLEREQKVADAKFPLYR